MSGFEGFRDSPSAPFYRSSARSPDDTWAQATLRLQAIISSATAATRLMSIDLSVPVVRFGHVIDNHDECLGWAMRKDDARTITPLAELIVELTH
jgi:hypothetical protein